jgi:two-component system sensor histidine kinase ArlS
MKTSGKISIIYSLITIGSDTDSGRGVLFLFFGLHTESVLSNILEEKAHAVAEEKFSVDEVDSDHVSQLWCLRRKNSIPTSKELFINVDDRKELPIK